MHISKRRNVDTEEIRIILLSKKGNQNTCDTRIVFSWDRLQQTGVKIYTISDLIWYEDNEKPIGKTVPLAAC